MMFEDSGTIYYTEVVNDKQGVPWYRINGEWSYDLRKWSKEEAEKDYKSEESRMRRAIDTARAWGAYD